MSNATDICARRIIILNEEDFRPDVYDDANGKDIVCIGQPTWGYGIRCRQISKWRAQQFLAITLQEFEDPLLLESWYIGCNDVRRSALLEIAFNQGDAGLENGYPGLIAAVRVQNWARAQAECTVKEDDVKTRYAVIGQILFSGVSV